MFTDHSTSPRSFAWSFLTISLVVLATLGWGPTQAMAATAFTNINAGLTGVTDSALAGSAFASEGSFTIPLLSDSGTTLTGVSTGEAAWGDYDSDGDLDLVISGLTQGNTATTTLYRNDAGSLVNANAGLTGASRGEAAWGDYDRDGDLDLAITGKEATILYRNDAGSFINTNAGISGGNWGALAWGDYDNDGDLDLVTSGNVSTHLYRNDGGSFIDAGAGLVGVSFGKLAWGDYDGDGDLDLVISGTTSSGYITRLYRNQAGSFINTNASLNEGYYGDVAWGDYDGDGDLDLLVSGRKSDNSLATTLYRNDNGSFVDANAGLPSMNYTGMAWGDYDNDGDLDLAINGSNAASSTAMMPAALLMRTLTSRPST
jgi:hypothetical protein